MAITWQNINAPSFAASNALRAQAANGFDKAFSGVSSALTDEGNRRKDINTDKAKAFAASMQGLDGFGDRRANFMAGLGNNIDRSAVSDAFNLRKEGLQGDQTFQDTRDLSALQRDELEYQQSDPIRKMAMDVKRASLNSSNSNIEKNRLIMDETRKGMQREQETYENTQILDELVGNYIGPNGAIDGKRLRIDGPGLGIPLDMINKKILEVDEASGATANRSRLSKNAVTDYKGVTDALANVNSKLVEASTKTPTFPSYGSVQAGKDIFTDGNVDSGAWKVNVFGDNDSTRQKEVNTLIDHFSSKIPVEELKSEIKGLKAKKSVTDEDVEAFTNRLLVLQAAARTLPSRETDALNKQKTSLEASKAILNQ